MMQLVAGGRKLRPPDHVSVAGRGGVTVDHGHRVALLSGRVECRDVSEGLRRRCDRCSGRAVKGGIGGLGHRNSHRRRYVPPTVHPTPHRCQRAAPKLLQLIRNVAPSHSLERSFIREVVYLGWADQQLGLRQADPGEYHYYGVGIEHLAFYVDTREEVDAAYQACLDLGAEIHFPPEEDRDIEGYYEMFVFDPDGMRVEVACAPPGGPLSHVQPRSAPDSG